MSLKKEALMDIFDAPAGVDLRSLEPSGGVLVITTYWRLEYLERTLGTNVR